MDFIDDNRNNIDDRKESGGSRAYVAKGGLAKILEV